MKLYRALLAVGCGAALLSWPATALGQGVAPAPQASQGPWPATALGQGVAPAPQASQGPWLPGRTPDGQPDIQGDWRPINGGTHSLDPAKSGAADFDERIGKPAKPLPSRIVDPADGHIPYQPWALALQKNLAAVYENPTRPEHVDTQTRCFTPGVPRLYYFPTFKILQPPGSVVFVWDEYHAYRVIPLDGRPHVPATVKLWMGDGRGRWEGNTLIVDTTNLNAKSRLNVVGDFFSDKARIVERFTPVDANTLNYEATITDPTVFTRPWTLRATQRRMPDEELWEWACHEGERDTAGTSSQFSEAGSQPR